MSVSQFKSRGFRALFSGVLVVFLLAGGILGLRQLASLRSDPERSESARPVISVRTMTAKPGPFREMIDGFGQARAIRSAPIAAEVNAVVEWVAENLEGGATVKQGDELVRLRRDDFEREVKRAEARALRIAADLKSTDATLQNLDGQIALAAKELAAAERELKRLLDLHETDVSSVSALDAQHREVAQVARAKLDLERRRRDAEATRDRARADAAEAAVSLDVAKVQLDRCSIAAPYNGIVVERTARVGSRVSIGSELFSIFDPARVEIPIAIASARFGQIEVGASAVLSTEDEAGREWRGKVARVAGQLDPDERTFLVYIVVENRDRSDVLAPGIFVRAEVEGQRHESVMAIPRNAFVGDVVYVARLKADRTARIEAVRPQVMRKLPGVALVTGGIEPGMRVCLTNIDQIANGSAVRVADDDEAEGEGQ